MDEPRNEGTPFDKSQDERLGRVMGAGAMTALSLAYPFAALAYFWHDWIKYARDASRVLIGTWGIAVPVNDWMLTLLSPWRVLMAAVTAKLLLDSARKLRRAEDGAKALSLLTLFGLVLPQSIWLFEFVNDWRAGQGLTTVAAMMAAMTALPAVLMSTRDGVVGAWGKLEGQNKARVLGAAVGMGWLGMAAMSIIDHSYQLRGANAVPAAIATMLVAALSMGGLYRQKGWALLTSLGAVGAAGATAAQVSNSTVLETGTAMDTALSTIATAPVASAALPTLVLLALMHPFYKGMIAQLAGKGEPRSGSEASGVRVDASAPIEGEHDALERDAERTEREQKQR